MGLALAFVWLLLARAAHAGEEFPPFLPGASEFPPAVRPEIISVWTAYTLTRGVEGRPARAPLATYRLFADYPDVTAAASRHLGLTKYRVEPVGPDQFAADDGEGAKGTYRVLVQDDRRRIMLTRGSHEGAILGRIGGGPPPSPPPPLPPRAARPPAG